jgi:hypothetical protein
MVESIYQRSLIKTLERMFDDCLVLKNDSSYRQGVPDLIVLYGPYWAMLEVKASRSSRFRPNQEYYIEMLNEMSFAASIYPENEDEVLDALQQAFGVRRSARASQRI